MGLLMSRLYNFLFGPLEARLCLLGIDAAGKTTILYKLKLGELVTTIPTNGFNIETVEFQNLSITVWDVGSQGIIRPLWRHYFDNNDGIIFVIDSTDQIRFDEARDELISLLEDDRLRNSPLLVLANKQDLANAASPAEITNMLGLTKMRSNSDWYVQRTSAVTGDGLVDGLTWLAGKIKSNKSNSLN